MYADYDSEANAYYFTNTSDEILVRRSVKQISLGHREVILDVDVNGTILGVEVL